MFYWVIPCNKWIVNLGGEILLEDLKFWPDTDVGGN